MVFLFPNDLRYHVEEAVSCFFDYGTQEEPIRAQITYLGSQKKLTVCSWTHKLVNS